MCAPGCVEYVRSKLSRRGFFKAAGAMAATATAAAWAPGEAKAQAFPRFSRVMDNHPHPLARVPDVLRHAGSHAKAAQIAQGGRLQHVRVDRAGALRHPHGRADPLRREGRRT